MDTDAGKLAMGVNLKFLEGIGGKQGRVWIQAANHALNGCFDHLLCIHLVDVIFLNNFNYIRKQLQTFVGFLVVGGQIPVKAVTQYQRGGHEHHGHPHFQVSGFSGCHSYLL